MKTCVSCGLNFDPVRASQKYCSDKCVWTFKNKKKSEQKKEEREKVPPLKRNCLHCGRDFFSYNKRLLYCSKKCYRNAKARRNNQRYFAKNGTIYRYQERICLKCKKEYKPTRNDQKYCSSECSATARKKFLSIPECLESASRKLDKRIGYVRVYCPMHPEANTWGYVYEHRLIMEGIIGRHLKKDEHIHHINGKRWDNSPENLQIMSPSEHSKLSFKGQDNG